MQFGNSDLAWAAGFFDGEGTIIIRRQGRSSYHLTIQVTQRSPLPLERLQRIFDGTITRQRTDGKGHYWYSWYLTGYKAANALYWMLPHMTLKDKEANIALEFQNKKPSVKVGLGFSVDEIERQSKLALLLRETRKNIAVNRTL